jgi:hypothetical protein
VSIKKSVLGIQEQEDCFLSAAPKSVVFVFSKLLILNWFYTDGLHLFVTLVLGVVGLRAKDLGD